MGEYADDAIHAGLDQSWGWRRRTGPRNNVCRHCGAEWLVWFEIGDDKWELREFDTGRKQYLKHSCKMKGLFKPKPKPPPPSLVWENELDDEVPF